MNIEDIKIGQTVWFVQPFSQINRGIVETKSSDSNKFDYVLVSDRHSCGNVLASDCFPTREALEKGLTERSEKQVKEYCDSIHDISDLMRFIFRHPIAAAEEYTDWDARRAVAMKTQELLGLNLEQLGIDEKQL